MRLSVVAALAAGFVFAQAPSTTAQPGSGKAAIRPRAVVRRRIAQALNLTDAQKQQVHAIFEARHASRKAEYQQLKAAKEAIAAKYTSTGTVAAADLSGSVSTITQLQAQMTNEQVQDAIAIRNVLTPAQLAQISATKAKLDSIHAEMKALWAQSGSPSASPSDSTSSDQ